MEILFYELTYKSNIDLKFGERMERKRIIYIYNYYN